MGAQEAAGGVRGHATAWPWVLAALTEDGRTFSQPKMALRFGQKGVACARVSRGSDDAFVFFVLHLERLAP